MADSITNDRLHRLGTDLGDALRRLIAAGDDTPPRPTDLARHWQLDQTACVRLCAALRSDDPLSLLYQLPGPPSLRDLVAAGEQARVPATMVEDARVQLRKFEEILRRLGGKKSNLDTVVGSRVVEAREKIEKRSKQGIFQGMTNLLGMQCDVAITSFFAYPSQNPDFVDELGVYGSLGLRRLRPELRTLVGGRVMTRAESDLARAPETELAKAGKILHGGEIRDDGYSTALKEFSTDPFPEVELVREDRSLLYTLPGDEQGCADAQTLLFASVERQANPRSCSANHQHAFYGFVPRNPSKYLIYDIFVHESLWQGIEPRLAITRNNSALIRSLAGPGASVRIPESFDFCESLESLGTTPAVHATRQFPRYGELVQALCDGQGWRSEEFRLYRLAMSYPVIGLQYIILFEFPDR